MENRFKAAQISKDNMGNWVSINTWISPVPRPTFEAAFADAKQAVQTQNYSEVVVLEVAGVCKVVRNTIDEYFRAPEKP